MHRREVLQAMLATAAAGATGCLSTPRPALVSPDGRPILELSEATTVQMENITVHTLRNGLTLIHRESRANSIVGIVALIKSGAAQLGDEKAGAANLAMRVLSKGTRRRSSDEIAEELGQLGASLSPSAGQDQCRLTLQCVNEDLPDAFDLFADVLTNPIFPVDQVELEKKKVLAGIRMNDDQTSGITAKRFRRELFGSHAYGRPVEGVPETVSALVPQDLFDFHRADFVPTNMIIAVAGAVSFNEVLPLVEKHLGAAGPIREDRLEVNKIIAPAGGRVEFTKDSRQAFIMLGHLTCPLGHEDQPALEVASNILGGGMSSRLFTILRDQQGLAYAVGATASAMRNQGMFYTYIGTNPANLDKAESGLWMQVRRLREEPVLEDELTRAKSYIAGGYLRAHERNMQQAGYLAYWHAIGRGVDYDGKYLDDINAVSIRDVMRVANKYFLDPTTVVLRPSATAKASG